MKSLEEVEEQIEEIEEEESKYRKILVYGVAVFLILLMVSYSAIGLGLGDIIVSLVITSPINDHTIIDDVTVVFENNTLEQLQEIYLETQQYEIKVCLLGEYDGNYTVTSLYEPTIYFQAFNRVISEGCSAETIVSLHSHPHRHCIASQQDLFSLELQQGKNPNAIIGVMCEIDRINFYQ